MPNEEDARCSVDDEDDDGCCWRFNPWSCAAVDERRLFDRDLD
jgi:hypothetical protein